MCLDSEPWIRAFLNAWVRRKPFLGTDVKLEIYTHTHILHRFIIEQGRGRNPNEWRDSALGRGKSAHTSYQCYSEGLSTFGNSTTTMLHFFSRTCRRGWRGGFTVGGRKLLAIGIAGTCPGGLVSGERH
jgi:hypothetical protein